MDILQKVRKYTVKICVNNDISTGVVFAPKSHDYLYVFTTLHSIEGFFEYEESNPEVVFSFFDQNGNARSRGYKKSELEFISFVGDGEDEKSDCKACEGTGCDIAVIRIPANTFCTNGEEDVVFPVLRIAQQNDVDTGTCLYGSGYPNNSPAPLKLTANINSFIDGERYYLECTLENINDFEDMLKGYSGGGMFMQTANENLKLVCLIDSCKAEEKNNHFFAVPVYRIIEKMKKQGWPDPRNEEEYVPETLDNFVDAAAKFFSLDFEMNEHEAIKMGIEDLQELGLKPACFFSKEGIDKFASIRCCENVSDCENYWKGQLIKAFCFCKINNEEIKNLDKLKYTLQTNDSKDNLQNIKIDFVCSKQRPGDFVRNLFDKKFHIENSKIEDGTIFIWNGINTDTAYYKIFDRKSLNRICQKIIANEEKRVTADGRKKLQNTDYNIINGDAPYFNYAIIGTEKLAEKVIGNSSGDEQRMKENLDKMINETWGENDGKD